MKKELLTPRQTGYVRVAQRDDNAEFWYARDLQKLLGYDEWRNFVKVINKAKEACSTSTSNILEHFSDVGKMIPLSKVVVFLKSIFPRQGNA